MSSKFARISILMLSPNVFFRSTSAGLGCGPAERQAQRVFCMLDQKRSVCDKGRGDGLNLPLEEFDVAFLPGQEARLLSSRGGVAEAGRWTLRNIELGDDYKAALAVEGSSVCLKYWEWLGGDQGPLMGWTGGSPPTSCRGG